MITEEQIDLLVERLVRRVEKANVYFLEKIGKSIAQIRELTPTQALQLINILKYGGNYEDIINQIAKYTNLNIQDIDAIFSNYAKKDQLFYRKFYEYRNIPFVPFDRNYTLKTQTMAFANLIKNEMYNYTRANVLGYSIKDINGVTRFMGLRDTYNYALDEALLNVSQGKDTFDNAMSRILKDIGGSGLKTLNYQSGRTMRLDSAIRMHLKDNLQVLHNELNNIYGKEFGSDGIEISSHGNPAPDHEEVQGHQFSNEEFEKLQDGYMAQDYKGKFYTLDHDGKNGYRPISQINCYHYTFAIVLGVSEPEYSDKQLQEIIDNNNKGFELDGKHYTNYEGTQLQRNLERAIREQKDIQILAKASNNDELVQKSQDNITKLSSKYKELSQVSRLPTKVDRLRVSGYRRKKVK